MKYEVYGAKFLNWKESGYLKCMDDKNSKKIIYIHINLQTDAIPWEKMAGVRGGKQRAMTRCSSFCSHIDF